MPGMRMAGRWAWGAAGLLLCGLVVAGCGMGRERDSLFGSEDVPETSAWHLGEGESVVELLGSDEAAAVHDSGASWAGDETAATPTGGLPDREESFSDKAGKMGLVLLGLGMTVGAAAAPYLLF
jgi:hypothetical protein